MNDIDRTASLAWLLSHAQNGELPDHLDEKDRAFLERLISVAIKHVPQLETEGQTEEQVIQQFVEITHTAIEGEYR